MPPSGARSARRVSDAAPLTPNLEDTSGVLPAHLLAPIFWVSLACVLAWAVVAALTPPMRHLLPYHTAVIVVISACLELSRRKLTRAAAALFAVSVWFVTQLPPFVSGHLDVPGIMLPLVSVMAVGLLWSTAAAGVLAGLSSLIWLGALWAGRQGLLPAPVVRGEIVFWMILTESLLMVVVFLHVATRALRQSLDAARTGADHVARMMREAPDGILLLDEDGQVMDANPAAELILGSPRERILSEPAFSPSYVSGGSNSARSVFESILAGGGAGGFEVEVVRSDGSPATVEAACRAIAWTGGRRVVEVILRDITARRRVERERLSLAEQVTVAQKMEAVGQLAGGVAHDFNNLLTVVGGCADLISEDPGANDSIIELAGEIRRAQEQAALLTRRLLAFAQLQVVEPRRMSMAQTVTELVPVLSTLTGAGVELHMDVTDEDTTVSMDRNQVEQILVNLAANARDAMHGRGRLEIFVHRVTLDGPLQGQAGVVGPGDYVVLSMRDDGIGIPSELSGRIFEPFFSTKPRGQASGLGLSAVLGIARQASGQITVRSRLGKGTRFSVYVPAATAGRTASAPA